MAGDVYHLTVKEILEFLGLSRSDFIAKEGLLFSELPRSATNRRYADIYTLVAIYAAVWNQRPSRGHVADFLFDIGFTDADKAKVVLARLEARGLIA